MPGHSPHNIVGWTRKPHLWVTNLAGGRGERVGFNHHRAGTSAAVVWRAPLAPAPVPVLHTGRMPEAPTNSPSVRNAGYWDSCLGAGSRGSGAESR